MKLGSALSNMYHNAPHGDAVAMIHVFGINYSKEIEASPFNKKEIAKEANIPESYGTEISKGVKLVKYVTVKNKF